jgi:hypothetical protein
MHVAALPCVSEASTLNFSSKPSSTSLQLSLPLSRLIRARQAREGLITPLGGAYINPGHEIDIVH